MATVASHSVGTHSGSLSSRFRRLPIVRKESITYESTKSPSMRKEKESGNTVASPSPATDTPTPAGRIERIASPTIIAPTSPGLQKRSIGQSASAVKVTASPPTRGSGADEHTKAAHKSGVSGRPASFELPTSSSPWAAESDATSSMASVVSPATSSSSLSSMLSATSYVSGSPPPSPSPRVRVTSESPKHENSPFLQQHGRKFSFKDDVVDRSYTRNLEQQLKQLRKDNEELLLRSIHSNEVASNIVGQDWDFIIHRATKIRATFTSEMDALLADVEALCSYSRLQRKLGAAANIAGHPYSPSVSMYTKTTAPSEHSMGSEPAVSHDTPTQSRSCTPSLAIATAQAIANAELGKASMAAVESSPAPSNPRVRDLESPVKVFRWRDSRLDVLFRAQADFRTIYYILVSCFFLFLLKLGVNEWFQRSESDIAFHAASLIDSFTGAVEVILPLWLVMYAFIHLLLPVMWLYRWNYIGNFAYGVVYVAMQVGLHAAVIYATMVVMTEPRLPIASCLILVCEQVRLNMKLHSFWRETVKMRGNTQTQSALPSSLPAAAPFIRDSPSKVLALAEDDVMSINAHFLDSLQAQFRAFSYFLWAPTLIYRNSYPMVRHVRWSFVLFRLCECIGCVLYVWLIWIFFCVPELEMSARHPDDLKLLAISCFNAQIPAIGVYLLAFFGLLHSWFNMWAEITRFADRQFYTDWWNSTDFATYYRKWNICVHDWLYEYVYNESYHIVRSKTFALFCTFVWSAIVHEYILCLAMGFFFPVLLTMFGFVGVGFIYVTRLCGRGHSLWNLFFWINLLAGNGILLILYAREHYAHQLYQSKQYITYQFDATSWIPLSWQPLVQRLVNDGYFTYFTPDSRVPGGEDVMELLGAMRDKARTLFTDALN